MSWKESSVMDQRLKFVARLSVWWLCLGIQIERIKPYVLPETVVSRTLCLFIKDHF